MNFDLFLFSTNTSLIAEATIAGVSGFVVDWERADKERRQQGHDTMISTDSVEDLKAVRAATPLPVLCRVNNHPEVLRDEIDLAIRFGADEILLPMVRSVQEVEQALSFTDQRVRLGILLETPEALEMVSELDQLPLSRSFIGLNDLAIERGTGASIFLPLIDGTLDRIREHISKPFGFGGITVLDGGVPLKAKTLMAEMVRLQASFSFLRRSFLKDICGRDIRLEIARIREYIAGLTGRAPEAIRDDRAELERQVQSA